VFVVYDAVFTVVGASLALPVLDGTMVLVRFQNLEESLLDLFLRSKLGAFHLTDDVPVQFVGSQRLTVDEMRVRRPWEAQCHPRVIHNFS
jgi:hypothetical protein